MRKLLAVALIGIPALYYFALIVGAATYPGYSHVTNYASELGAADAPHPQLFNVPIMMVGITAVVAALLLPREIRGLGGSRIWAILAAVALAMWGVSMVMGGMYPMPDDRHGAFGLGLAAPLVPLFMLLTMRSIANSRAMQIFLGAVFVSSIVMLAIMFGVGQLVTRANVGLYQRLNIGVSIPWLAVLGAWLLFRVPTAEET
jgi:hypothetical membrane protein